MGRTPAPVRTRALVCPCRGPAPIAAQDLEAVRSCPRAEHGERIEGAHRGVSDDRFWTATHGKGAPRCSRAPGAHPFFFQNLCARHLKSSSSWQERVPSLHLAKCIKHNAFEFSKIKSMVDNELLKYSSGNNATPCRCDHWLLEHAVRLCGRTWCGGWRCRTGVCSSWRFFFWQ
jgi:hypothetical protein